jgi:hypothetical protein
VFPALFRLGHAGEDAADLEKEEARGQREVLLEEAVALEAPRGVREKRLVFAKSDPANTGGRQDRARLLAQRARRLNHHAESAGEDLFEDADRHFIRATHEKTQAIQLQRLEWRAIDGLEADAESGAGAELLRDLELPGVARVVTRLGHADGPDVHCLRRAILAGRSFIDGMAAQHGIAGQDERMLHQAHIRQGLEPDHRRRWAGAKIMRKDGLEDGCGEPGKLGVELELDAGRKKGKAFEEPFDEGIGAGLLAFAVERQAARDLREFARKLRRHLAEMLKLDVIEIEQPFIHAGSKRRAAQH